VLKNQIRIIGGALGIALGFVAEAAAQRAPTPGTQAAPEAATGFAIKPQVTARQFMVVAANPLAVDAGYDILARGGTAVDAAIAVQLVLTLVEPQSSGLGGGAFLVHYHRPTRRMTTIDGRETAPASAVPGRFLKPDGMPLAFQDAVFGGLSVGVPGVVRLMADAHQKNGRVPWRELFQPAIRLAAEGFAVSPRLSGLLTGFGADAFGPAARALYFDAEGRARPEGYVLKNPDLAATLQRLAEGGADAFYAGPIAEGIVAAIANAPRNPGDMTLADLAGYRTVERPALCKAYRTLRVCGMGPPSSGGLAINQILGLVEPLDLGRQPMSPNALHLIAEAQKLAYADRDRYVGDPDHVAIPRGLLDDGYLSTRRRLINASQAMPKAEPGVPPSLQPAQKRAGIDTTEEATGTSHISIIDAEGSAVALTTTIENAFGSRLQTGGFLLNNQLTDFAFNPRDSQGQPLQNAVAPRKRPRSSMAPTIIVDRRGNVRLVTGSPGGSRIILYVAKTIIGTIDWGLSAQTTAELANFGSRNGPFEIEISVAGIVPSLHMTKRGHTVRHEEMTSGVHMIVRTPSGRLEAGIDPRREGAARGR
jgi:gamma-glutamyltranspeptidase / glutathione hydrolase